MSDKRTQLEAVATDAVQRTGLHSLSFRTLADEVGIKSSSVHYYFPEKAHLAQAIIKNYTAVFGAKLASIDTKQLSLPKKLDAFVKIFEDALKDDKLCLCGMMAAEVKSLDDKSRELLSEYFNQSETWLAQLLVEAEGEISSLVKPRVLAKVIMSGLEGALLLDRAEQSTQRIRAQKELIRALVS